MNSMPRMEERPTLILAICTPIMARVHRYVRKASELHTALIDLAALLFRIGSRCYSSGGYLLFLMSHRLLLMALCVTGPELILTDGQTAQHQVIRQVWLGTTQLLYLFRKGGGDGYWR